MRRYIFVPVLLGMFILSVLLIPRTPNNTPKATMMQLEDVTSYESVESVMDDAVFIVKGKLLKEEEYVAGLTYRYKFQLLQDYANNMRTDSSDESFYVYSHVSEQYEVSETYYLFLTAFEAYMAGTIMYEAVDDHCIIQDTSSFLNKQVAISLDSADPACLSVEQSSFECELYNFSCSNSEIIAERTTSTFASDDYTTLTDAYYFADAIWKITITSSEEFNPEASICSYRIDQVFCGNTTTAPEGSVFQGIFPTDAVEINQQYYVLLSDVGDYEYEPFSFDFWLFPVESPDCLELLQLISNNPKTNSESS